MIAAFLCSHLPTFCRKWLFALIGTTFGCALCGSSAATPGQLDTSFGGGGIVILTAAGDNGYSASIAAHGDDAYIVGGTVGSFPRFSKARVLGNGNVDLTFSSAGQPPGPLKFAEAVAVTRDRHIILAGTCVAANGPYAFGPTGLCVARFSSEGILDSSFGDGSGSVVTTIGTSDANGHAVAVDSQNRIVLVGECDAQQAIDFCMARYNEDGSLDASFNGNGMVTTDLTGNNDSAFDLVIQADGKLLVSGHCFNGVGFDFCIARYHANGLLDLSFGTSGKVVAALPGTVQSAAGIALQDDSQILVAGGCQVTGELQSFCLVRLAPNGSLDVSFGDAGHVFTSFNSGSANARDLALQADGKIVLAGACYSGSRSYFCAARYNANGVLDATFGVGGKALFPAASGDSYGTRVIVDAGGKIVIAGSCTTGGMTYLCVARLEGGAYPSAACALNVDGNLATRAYSDVVIIIRYLLGYRGDALSAGAFGQNATRTGHVLETYLASLNLDADGDGQVNALTDGLLILRALLGLSGDALTVGAVNTSSPTARNAQQILTWIESTHGVACLP